MKTAKLTVKEVAWLLGKSVHYVYQMRAAGFSKLRFTDSKRPVQWIHDKGFAVVRGRGKVKK